MIRITSRMPISSARVRLSIDCSMNVAGRKIVVSISMPGRPGRISSIASSMPLRDLHRVGAAELLDDQHQARAVVDDALAPDRLVVLDVTLPRSPRRSTWPLRRSTGTLREVSGGHDRLDVADVQPLGRRLDEAAGADHEAVRVLRARPASSASEVVSITWSSETPFLASLLGIDLDVALLEALAEDVRPAPRRARAGCAA